MNQIIGVAPKALCSNCRVHKPVTMIGPWHLCSWCSNQNETDMVGAQSGRYEIVGEDPNVLLFVTSGRRYKSQNPYTIPEVKKALEALHKSSR